MKLYNDTWKHLIKTKMLRSDNANNFELDAVGKKLFGKKYLGTFASDKLPKKTKSGFFISNVDTSDKGGSHWMSGVHHKGKRYIYDSYARNIQKLAPAIGSGVIESARKWICL